MLLLCLLDLPMALFGADLARACVLKFAAAKTNRCVFVGELASEPAASLGAKAHSQAAAALEEESEKHVGARQRPERKAWAPAEANESSACRGGEFTLA